MRDCSASQCKLLIHLANFSLCGCNYRFYLRVISPVLLLAAWVIFITLSLMRVSVVVIFIRVFEVLFVGLKDTSFLGMSTFISLGLMNFST